MNPVVQRPPVSSLTMKPSSQLRMLCLKQLHPWPWTWPMCETPRQAGRTCWFCTGFVNKTFNYSHVLFMFSKLTFFLARASWPKWWQYGWPEAPNTYCSCPATSPEEWESIPSDFEVLGWNHQTHRKDFRSLIEIPPFKFTHMVQNDIESFFCFLALVQYQNNKFTVSPGVEAQVWDDSPGAQDSNTWCVAWHFQIQFNGGS